MFKSHIVLILFSLTAMGATKPAPYFDEISKILSDVRGQNASAELVQFLAAFRGVKKSADLESNAHSITEIMFDMLKLEPDNEYLSRNRLDNVLPDAVLKQKKGHCLGLTVLFVLAAESLGMDVAIARAPDHIFPRLCSSQKCVNVEMLKKGKLLPDRYYRENFFIPEKAIKLGFYLKSSRSPKDLSASIFLGLGFVATAAEQPELAKVFYKKAIENNPRMAEAHSNYAAVLLGFSEKTKAEAELKRAYELNPYAYSIATNLGVLAHNAKRYQEALAYYNRAVEMNPVSAPAFRKRARLFEDLGQSRKAAEDLLRVLAIQPSYCDVAERYLSIAEREKMDARKVKEKLEAAKTSGQCLSLGL